MYFPPVVSTDTSSDKYTFSIISPRLLRHLVCGVWPLYPMYLRIWSGQPSSALDAVLICNLIYTLQQHTFQRWALEVTKVTQRKETWSFGNGNFYQLFVFREESWCLSPHGSMRLFGLRFVVLCRWALLTASTVPVERKISSYWMWIMLSIPPSSSSAAPCPLFSEKCRGERWREKH